MYLNSTFDKFLKKIMLYMLWINPEALLLAFKELQSNGFQG